MWDMLFSVFSKLFLTVAAIYVGIWVAALMMSDKNVDDLAAGATNAIPGAPMVAFLALAIKARKNKNKKD